MALACGSAVHHLVDRPAGRPRSCCSTTCSRELDPARSRALVRELPAGQALLTTAVPLPAGVDVAAVVDVPSVVGTSTVDGRTGA